MRSTVLTLMLLMLGTAAGSQDRPVVDYRTFGAIRARHIGPAVMGGRISAICAVNNDPRIIYVGAAGGGLWKTTNGGVTFEPVFDEHTQSIGGIAIDQVRPDTLWVGTGEPWVRNSVSVGTGIYRSVDGGENWIFMGLPNSERINTIAISPKNPATVYVAVLGGLWSDSPDRGVYRTTNGGETWDRVLYVNPRTGCADLAVDPGQPSTLYAAMWEHRRRPFDFNSGGPGSGLYKSTDGGTTWKKLTAGLPAGDLGRIAIAVAPSKPNVVYAAVEAADGGFFRSADRGAAWSRMTSETSVIQRPFYFSLLAVDPRDHNRVYKPGFALGVSADSGASWSTYAGSVHSDLHAIWIDPRMPKHILLGTDGGAYESVDGGGSWRMFLNLPVSQFYHVAFDFRRPYNVYGGLQDNGSWMGPSASPDGIQNRNWDNIGMGDGFAAFPDPKDTGIVYWEYQGGNIFRRYLGTHDIKQIKPYRQEGEPHYRWNWNTPFVTGPKSGALYIGSQFVFRSTDEGDSWRKISPDLTTNDTSKLHQTESGGLTLDNSTAENYCTVFSIAESPVDASVIWAGTDDGNVQVTRDGGTSWTNVTASIPELPPNSWCMCVSGGYRNAGTAYAAFSAHQTGNFTPYVYRTTDFGGTWTSIVNDSVKGFAHVIREDPVNPDLCFLGTEFGLYLTIDGGRQWARFTGNFPKVPVYDLVIHPREADLICATHGRGIVIIDDITPLRSMTPEALSSDCHIFPSRPIQSRIPKFGQSFPGDQEFIGDNPSESASITYFLKKRPVFGDLNVEIFSPEGKLLKVMPGGKYKGLNRVRWVMRMKPPKVPPSPDLAGYALFGPMVPPGTYTFNIVRPDTVFHGSFRVVPDSSAPFADPDRQLQYATVMKLYAMQGDLAYIADAISECSKNAAGIAAKVDSTDPLRSSLMKFSARLDSLYRTMLVSYQGAGITAEQKLREHVVELYGLVSNFGGRPTESQLAQTTVLEHEIRSVMTFFTGLHTAELPALNTRLGEKNLEPLRVMTREEYDRKEAAGK